MQGGEYHGRIRKDRIVLRAGGTPARQSASTGGIEMQPDAVRVAVLAEDAFEDLELWYPVLRLQEEGFKVTVVGSGSARQYKGKYGLKVDVDAGIDEVTAEDFDGVVVPGGWAPDRLRRYPQVLKLVKDLDAAGKPVAAICHAGWVLASARIVRGRRMTCTVAIKDDMENAGAIYLDEPVVRDGNLITSRRPSDLPFFCRELITALTEGGTPTT